MAWTYTTEQILSILTATGVLVGTVVTGVQVILSRINKMQDDSRQRTVEVKAQVEAKTTTIEQKVDVVQEQSDGRLSRIEEELRAARQEGMAMARELTLIGELRQKEEATRRALAAEAATAVQVDAAMDRAHAQASQQQETAPASTDAPIVSSGPVTIAQVPSVTVEEADSVHVQRPARPPKP